MYWLQLFYPLFASLKHQLQRLIPINLFSTDWLH
jgi:hypothetical protein